ncbi:MULTISPECIES: DUF3093 domain-containing protein [Micrococcaceae]|uniref:DUF3093 domain-containing protein n=1 Tax=Micrococcaceae TaxID=1268 RepID=UPI00103678AE|nr:MULTISPECIES: DUF3093 domain-containing protein [Micrococcaceae]TAP27609.1 DUF3093 domain-containing protein [Arthrobacter sp. S41]UXN30722.1 DUF3093 domain-containing protein [Glutamicibacter sp. M10]
MSNTSPEASRVLYTEKLWPSASTWIWPIIIAITAGVAVAPINVILGWSVGAAFLIALVVIFLVRVPAIEVTESTVSAGRASIEREFIGEVTGYRGNDAFKQRGQKLHGLAYMVLRGWLDGVVKMEVTDERDTTPYWLISTRRPEELAAALSGVMYEFTEEGKLEAEKLEKAHEVNEDQ